MTEAELTANNAAAHEATIEKYRADIDRSQTMAGTPSHQTQINHALDAFKRIPNSRRYAADLDFCNAAAALVQAYCDERMERGERGSFTREGFRKEILEPLTTVLPELIQSRPPPEPEPPKPWIDEVTGQYAKNPWSKPVDLTSQGEVKKRDPELAKHLEATAEGASYSFLARLQDERETREKIRTLPYTEKEHLSNPFHIQGRDGLKVQGEFIKTNPPFVVNFYQAEAAKIPSLPFQVAHRSMTKIMQCHRLSPQIAAVITRAEKIYADHRRAELQRLEAVAASATAELQRVRERSPVK